MFIQLFLRIFIGKSSKIILFYSEILPCIAKQRRFSTINADTKPVQYVAIKGRLLSDHVPFDLEGNGNQFEMKA